MFRCLFTTAALTLVVACDRLPEARAPEVVPPRRAPMPAPPMTAAKAAQALDGLPLQCRDVAILRYDLSRCTGLTPQGLPDDGALLAELAALRAELEALDPDAVGTICSTRYAEMEAVSRPRACFP